MEPETSSVINPPRNRPGNLESSAWVPPRRPRLVTSRNPRGQVISDRRGIRLPFLSVASPPPPRSVGRSRARRIECFPRLRLSVLPAPPVASPRLAAWFHTTTSEMAANVGESTSAGGSGDAAGGSFECNICFELPQEPIVTLCGHLFCWPCLYRWLHVHAHSPECPVCKALVEEDKLVPLYGRGTDRVDPRSKNMPEADIPHRPTGQRPATAPQADTNNNNFANANANPWFMGTGVPLANARWGNYAFSAAFGGLFPMLSFQVHGFPDAAAYAQPAGFHYGFGHGHGHGFHGGHMGQAHSVQRQAPMGQQQQADVYLKGLLMMVAVLVIASLLAF